ncbi:MAG TPA: hypothetical protein VFA27_16210 [Vicinamibacterales bacterium]|nr:hypothetical protein [Vicinamibacterales bacterium]
MWTVLAIVVHVTLAFDPSIHSRIVRSGAADEATAIWRDYGVDLDWTGRAPADLCLSARVERTPHAAVGQSGAVLGSAYVPQDAARGIAPIRIGFDALDALAEPTAAVNVMLHEYAVSTAIGRVLAHEIGHILLGKPSYHDERGLMRPAFASTDFSRSDRSRFRLDDRSVERLHARLPELSSIVAAPGCPAR